MLRLLEVALFLLPFVALALWRLTAPVGGPSPRFIVLVGVVLVLLAGGMVWFSREHKLPSGAVYVPAELHDGRLVPGRGAAP